ncbi:MAG: phosphatidylglycerophosphatase A [Acidiferrobacterales bacterium]
MLKRNSVPESVWTNPVHFLAFGLGSGAAPYAPGTFGTLAAIPLYLLMVNFLNWPAYAAVVAIMFLLGVWMCDLTERDIGVHDHSGIVWDEFVGFLVTMFYAPTGWIWIVAGFFLFRLFDIWKPYPVRQLERRYRNGFGNMVDDLIAGLYAGLALQALVYLSGQPRWAS